MSPSECPICHRIYCDHTCAERGQTFTQMMGDPPGSHPHDEERAARGKCCCDDCTDPRKRP